MDHLEILKTLPHRYPFLFVDRIVTNDLPNSITGYKNVTLNEPYVHGTCSEKPRFPESLITECMAQVGAVAILSNPINAGKLMLFAGVENLRFYRPVYPGDQLISQVIPLFAKPSLGKMKATARVADQLVAEGSFTYALAPGQP